MSFSGVHRAAARLRTLRGLSTAPGGLSTAPGSLSLPSQRLERPAPSTGLEALKRAPLTFEENRMLRNRHLAPALKMHYDGSRAGPIKLAYGEGQYLYDTDGVRYLDCVNNVCHVGHCHPRVVKAAAQQLATLNTSECHQP